MSYHSKVRYVNEGEARFRPPKLGRATTSLPNSSQTCIRLRPSAQPLHMNMPPHVDSQNDERAAKRRKVRKGTQSCWECKKRKVRCTWALLTNSTCDNCLRRKTKCVSQEFADDSPGNTRVTDGGVEDRLGRVENLLERLVNGTAYAGRDALGSRLDTAVMNSLSNSVVCISC